MAEIVGTTAAIGSILKAVVSAGTLIQSISQAPQEARQVADQIEATKAVLKSLQASLKTVNRPPEFLRIWNGSTRVILGNIRTTIEELNGRLGGQGTTPPRIVKLTFWRRVAWPLDREEGLRLQLQLQTYLQLLAITQNALMKGTAQDAESSAHEVEDTLSNIGTFSILSPDSNLRPSPPSSIWSGGDSNVLADDSASQIGITPGPVLAKPSSNHLQKSFPTSIPTSLPESTPKSPAPKSLGTMRREIKPLNLSVRDKNGSQSLGGGSLTVYETSNRIWLVFRPSGIEKHESRWYIRPQADADYTREIPPVIPDIAGGGPADEETLWVTPSARRRLLRELENARLSIWVRERRDNAKSAAIRSASRMAR